VVVAVSITLAALGLVAPAANAEPNLIWLSVDSGAQRQLTSMAPDGSGAQAYAGTYYGVVSPDRTQVAWREVDLAGLWHLKVSNIDGSSSRTVATQAPGYGYGAGPVWSPDSAMLAVSSNAGSQGLDLINVDGSGHRFIGTAAQSGGVLPGSWSADGGTIAVSTDVLVAPGCSAPPLGQLPPENVGLLSVVTEQITLLTRDCPGAPVGYVNRFPKISPDGLSVAYVHAHFTQEVEVVGIDGSNRRAIPNTPTQPVGPAWAPDSQRLAYYGFVSGQPGVLRTVNLDGTDNQAVYTGIDGSSGATVGLEWSNPGAVLSGPVGSGTLTVSPDCVAGNAYLSAADWSTGTFYDTALLDGSGSILFYSGFTGPTESGLFGLPTNPTGTYTYAIFAGLESPPYDPSTRGVLASATFTCPTGGGADISIVSVTGQLVNTAARKSNVVNLAGGGWAPSAAVSTVTVGGSPAVHTLVVDGFGALSGGVVVPAAATTGNASIVVTQGTITAITPILILGTPSLTLSPANGSAGTPVTASGSNFDPGRPTSVFGGRSNPNGICQLPDGPTPGPPCNDPIGNAVVGPYVNTSPPNPVTTVTASATGTFSAATAPEQAGTTGVIASQTGPSNSAYAAYGFFGPEPCVRQVGSGPTTLCETKQNVTASVTPGALTQQALSAGLPGYNATTIPMGSVTTAIAAQTLTGQINPITVTDVRGGTATWSLTAAMPDLAGSGTAAGSAIEATNLALGAVTCADQPGSASGITAGMGGNFGGAALTICDASSNAADSDGDNVGGQWIADAPLTLTVPAFQQAGAYSSTITFTLT
jgi:Tol biopolymer transport system component